MKFHPSEPYYSQPHHGWGGGKGGTKSIQLIFLKVFSAIEKDKGTKIGEFLPKFHGEHFDKYFGASAGRLLLW